MTVYIISCITKDDEKYHDCRRISRIIAKEHHGERTVTLSRSEASRLVARGLDRLWLPTGSGFIPVVPAINNGTEYVRTEPIDTMSDILLKQPDCRKLVKRMSEKTL